MVFECRVHGTRSIHRVEYDNGIGVYCDVHGKRECKSRVFLTNEERKKYADAGCNWCVFGRDSYICK